MVGLARYRLSHRVALLLLCVLLLPAACLGAGNETNDSYGKAKQMLNRIYADHRVTIYCQAPYDASRNIIIPSGFETPAHFGRVYKMEWEHAVPAENFGRAFAEWRDGDPACIHKNKPFKGRRCAEKVNMRYRYMQADMYNLFPAIGAVNAVRGNSQYSELPGEAAAFGDCQAKVRANRFEPPDAAKGEVARASLYMADAYDIFNLSAQQRRLFEAWDKTYPVTAWECERARRIEKLQGNPNNRVKNKCLGAGL